VLIPSITEEILLYVSFFLFTGLNQDYPIPESVDKVDISIPMEGTLYDYTYNFKHKGSWKYWPDILKSVHPAETVNIQHMLIPTAETLRSVSGIY
jgi:dynein heavy chain